MLAGSRVSRADLMVASGFVLAAVLEAVVMHGESLGLLVFTLCGAPVLFVLALRHVRPVVPLVVIAAFSAIGATSQAAFWPGSGDGGATWLLALLLACYSLGAHARARSLWLACVLPLLVALVVDLPDMSGWSLVNGIVFVTLFLGVLPALVGRLVRIRREGLDVLEGQRALIVREQRSRREAAALAERLTMVERLQPALLDGLEALADSAEHGSDAGLIEREAQQLLRRTREEVVQLTAPVDIVEPSAPATADHLAPLRAAAQPWVVLGAGAVGAGMALEATGAMSLRTEGWVAVLACLVIALPLSAMWWRPVGAVAVAWCGAVGFSRFVAPLDGSLSGSAFVLASAFGVAALAARRGAVAGLAIAELGELLGIGPDDPVGVAALILVCWLGGLAVHEAGRLVEESRANNRVLAGREVVAKQRAVVEERIRLARDIHDQIGHALTVVALHAGAARRLATTDPERAAESMATIVAAARDGLAGMRGEAAADLERLLRRTTSAGLDVTADLTGLDGSVDRQQREVAHRVVQEALTNVLRHAPGSRATVVVRRRGPDLHIGVTNTRSASAGPGGGSGRGLALLRETVEASGGVVEWGATPDGFGVTAAVPARHVQGARR